MEFLEIISKAQKGDLRTASSLAMHLGPMVETMCRTHIKKSDTWKDASQMVFACFFKQLPSLHFEAKGALVNYLQTLVKNQCFKQLNKDTIYQKNLDIYYRLHADDNVEVENELESLLLAEDVQEMAKQLPDLLQMLFHRIVFEKCDYKDLSLELGIPESTLRSYMCRARKILKKIMYENL